MTEVALINVAPNLPSFGGKSFSDNALAVEAALEETAHLQLTFNHSNSQWAWRHLICHYLSPARNLRQVAAELSRKQGALFEAKWRCAERNQDIRELEAQYSSDPSERLAMEIQRSKEKRALELPSIEGAMKDVLTLKQLYDDIVAKHGLTSEEDFERAETISHLCRALLQSIRDIRQSGAISTGNQEYMEQIGVNPTRLLNELLDYVKREGANDDWGTSYLNKYVEELAARLAPLSIVRMEYAGYSPQPTVASLMPSADRGQR